MHVHIYVPHTYCTVCLQFTDYSLHYYKYVHSMHNMMHTVHMHNMGGTLHMCTMCTLLYSCGHHVVHSQIVEVQCYAYCIIYKVINYYYLLYYIRGQHQK